MSKSATFLETEELKKEVEKLTANGLTTRAALQEVASSFSMKLGTVRSRYYRFSEEKWHGNHLLTKAEEKALVSVFVGFSNSHLPLSFSEALEIARFAFDNPENALSRRWFQDFCVRHSDVLRFGTAQQITPGRVSKTVLPTVESWVADFEKFLSQWPPFTKDRVLNGDETRLMFSGEKKIHCNFYLLEMRNTWIFEKEERFLEVW
jgi:hypothetical protein